MYKNHVSGSQSAWPVQQETDVNAEEGSERVCRHLLL